MYMFIADHRVPSLISLLEHRYPSRAHWPVVLVTNITHIIIVWIMNEYDYVFEIHYTNTWFAGIQHAMS